MSFNRRSVRRFAHRRLTFAAVMAALLITAPVVLAVSVMSFSGELTESSPTFARPRDCSTAGPVSYYGTQEFDVDETGTYTVQTTDANLFDPEMGPKDTYLALYQDSFDPANPLTNCVEVNDDIKFPDNVLSRITQTLTAGHYIIVVTTPYGIYVTGTYKGTISGGPGRITLSVPPTDTPKEEPAPSAGAPWNPGDGRLNPDPAAPAAVYYSDGALKVYMLNGDAEGYEVLSMAGSEIMGLCSPAPATNTLIASADEGHVQLYCLSTGEIQLNVNHGATEVAYVWDTLPPSTMHTYAFNADGELLSESFKQY